MVLALTKRFDKKIKIWSDQSLKQFEPGPCPSCFMFCSVLFSVSCFQNDSRSIGRRRGSIFLHIKRTNRGAIETDFEETDLNIE